MGEVPLVIVDVQRMGPATGGATTTAQGDVQLVRWSSSGGYPVIALAPSSVAECFSLTMEAFDLAERFRCPVFLMTDKELNLTTTTVDLDDYRPREVQQRTLHHNGTPDAEFQPYRYEPAASVPPMAHFGDDDMVRFTGSTHDERGFITKDAMTVERLNRHLAAKIDDHAADLERVTADLDPASRTLWLSYGSTAGAMRQAVRQARADGRRVSAMTIQSLWPVPERAISEAMASVDRVVVAELNHGQYRHEVERLANGAVAVEGLHRLDGALIAPQQFLDFAP